ncbi:hypothetical protein D3C75_1132920 [compost metagenome]
MTSSLNPRRRMPSKFMLRASAGLPNTVTKAGTSLPIAVPMPEKACAPMWQYWCTRVKPDRIAQSPTCTCPASAVLLTRMQWLPITLSWPMWA